MDGEEFHASRVSHKQLKFFLGVMLFRYCYYHFDLHKCTVVLFYSNIKLDVQELQSKISPLSNFQGTCTV